MKSPARVLAIAMMMTPLLAAAQLGNTTKITANVPFEFVVGDRTVPAGQCSALSGNGGATLMIRNADANVSRYSIVATSSDQTGTAKTALIFHKYGDRYFLSGLELAGSHAIYWLPAGKAETELRAQNAPVTEEILLAALK